MTSTPFNATRILLAVALLQVALFLWFFATSIYPLPRWDHYDWIAGYLDANSKAAWLWLPHNEHRIIPTKLAVIFDIEFFRGLLTPIALVSLTMLPGWVTVLARTAKRIGEQDTQSITVFTCLLAIVSFQTFTLDNYTYPANNAFPVTIFLFIVAVCTMTLAVAATQREAGDTKWLVIALLAASACTFASLNAIFVWPILFYLCWKQRYRRGLFLVAIIAAIILTLHIPGLLSLSTVSTIDGDSTTLLRYARYYVAYFGMPWAAVPGIAPAGYLAGTIVILLGTGAIMKSGLLRRGSHLEDVGLALILFAGLTAAMTTVGRAAQFDLPAHRYTVFAVVAHIGLLCIYWPQLWRILQAMGKNRVGRSAMLAIAVALVCQQTAVGHFAQERAAMFSQVKTKLLDGDRSAEVIGKVFYDHDLYLNHLALMQREGIYLYRDSAPEED